MIQQHFRYNEFYICVRLNLIYIDCFNDNYILIQTIIFTNIVQMLLYIYT
jgi:hypothetical protein